MIRYSNLWSATLFFLGVYVHTKNEILTVNIVEVVKWTQSIYRHIDGQTEGVTRWNNVPLLLLPPPPPKKKKKNVLSRGISSILWGPPCICKNVKTENFSERICCVCLGLGRPMTSKSMKENITTVCLLIATLNFFIWNLKNCLVRPWYL